MTNARFSFNSSQVNAPVVMLRTANLNSISVPTASSTTADHHDRSRGLSCWSWIAFAASQLRSALLLPNRTTASPGQPVGSICTSNKHRTNRSPERMLSSCWSQQPSLSGVDDPPRGRCTPWRRPRQGSGAAKECGVHDVARTVNDLVHGGATRPIMPANNSAGASRISVAVTDELSY